MSDGTRVIKKRTKKHIKIPYDFFEKHLAEMDGEHLKIYLYAYYGTTKDDAELSGSMIMDKLHVSREAIEAAWQYCSDAGLISLEENSIEFLDMDSVYKKNTSAAAAPKKKGDAMRYLSGNSEFKNQIAYMEAQLGGEASHRDIEELYDLLVESKVPFEVVAAAAGHCAARGIRNIAYISKVALDWMSQGLDNFEKIELHLMEKEASGTATDSFGEWKKLFPLNRDFYDVEERYLKVWIEEYGVTTESLKDAIDKTILNTGKVNFQYIDKIIKNAGSYQTVSSGAAYGKKTAVHNYTQPGFDYDKISQVLRAKQPDEK